MHTFMLLWSTYLGLVLAFEDDGEVLDLQLPQHQTERLGIERFLLVTEQSTSQIFVRYNLLANSARILQHIAIEIGC
jgi:hypothetical protein